MNYYLKLMARRLYPSHELLLPRLLEYTVSGLTQ